MIGLSKRDSYRNVIELSKRRVELVSSKCDRFIERLELSNVIELSKRDIELSKRGRVTER